MKACIVLLCFFLPLCLSQVYKTIAFGNLAVTLQGAAAPFTLGVATLDPTDLNQQFLIDSATGFIYSRTQPTLVFDVKGSSTAANTPVTIYAKKTTANTNQKFTVTSTGAIKSNLAAFYLRIINDPVKGNIVVVSYTTPIAIPAIAVANSCNPPCANGGTCNGATLTCSCTASWSGATCTTPVCANACQNGGTCTGVNVCTCPATHTGATCATPVCTTPCMNGGTCTGVNTCTCPTGWSGATCTTPVCTTPCMNGGTCTGANTCTCPATYTGATCTTPVCTTPCQHGGTCSAPNVCTCPATYSGPLCATPVCATPCMNGGTCSAPDVCTCPATHTGPLCATPVCTTPCQNGGTCSAPNVCTCPATYTGATCTTPVCATPCMNGGTCTGVNTCTCPATHTGPLCATPVCNNACQNGGTCTAPNTCTCPTGWSGATCTTPGCAQACQNGGTCTGVNTCTCPATFAGTICQTPVCTTPCQNGGTCTAPNSCTCPAGWTGASCTTRLVTRPITCTSWGDPHIIQFESNANLQWPGIQKAGTFKLAIFGNPITQVAAEHQPWSVNPSVYTNKKLSIKQGTDFITVELGAVLTISGTATTVAVGATFTVSPFVTVTRESAGNFRINVPNGYIRCVNQGTYIDIYVVITSGTWPTGGICSDVPGTGARKKDAVLDTFIESWRISAYGDDPFGYPSFAAWRAVNPLTYPTSNGSFTTNDASLQSNALALCEPLRTGDLVTQCTPFVDPVPFYKACVDDCIASGDIGFAFTSKDAYTHACGFRAPAGAITAVKPTSGPFSHATGLGLAASVPQSSVATTFTIQSTDSLGVDKTDQGDQWQVTSVGPSNIQFTIVATTLGRYTVTYTPNVVGAYNISVKLQGVAHCAGSPFLVKVENLNTNAAQSTASGLGLSSTIVAGDVYSFTVQARTASGAPRTVGGDSVTVVIEGTATVHSIADLGDGTYKVAYTQNFIGTFRIFVRIANILILGNPWTVTSVF